MYKGIIKSNDKNTIELCRDIGKEIQTDMMVSNDIASFLLDLQENEFHFAIMDCQSIKPICIKWIKFIRRLYPKLPLIVLCRELDKNMGAKIYEEKIFYLGLHPLERQNFQEVLGASLRFSTCKE